MSSRGVNKTILIGNLGKDPEIRYSSNGAVIATLNIATTERWKDRNSGNMSEHTEWHRISLFNKLAEIAGQYLRKGSTVYIEGKIRTDKWTDQQGIERYSTKIIADTMQMLGGGQQINNNTDNTQRDNTQRDNASNNANNNNDDATDNVGMNSVNFNDDIPF